MSMFSVSKLCASYGRHAVLEKISFSIEGGMLAGLLGENGSGKTTLLKSICGIHAHEGTCTLNGKQLEGLSARKIARLCSYIPQRSGISIELSVMDVVLMGFNPHLKLLAQPDKSMFERAKAALSDVGMESFVQCNYLSLSEGQKQLCILARALAADTPMMLLDEPESALDFRIRHRVLDILKRQLNQQKCALVSLHDPSLALNSCDRLFILKNGRLQAALHPKSDPIAEMEAELSAIYGCVSLHCVKNRDGNEQLIMIKEEET